MSGLRDMLFDTLDKLRAGTIQPNEAKTVAQVAQTILNSAEVQMEYERMRMGGSVPNFLPGMALTNVTPEPEQLPALPQAEIDKRKPKPMSASEIAELREKQRREQNRESMRRSQEENAA